MKRKLLFLLIVCMFMFTSCNKYDFETSANEQIKANVEKIFGVQFDETQDWCSTTNGSIRIIANTSNENIVKAQILMSSINETDEDTSVDMKILNEANISKGGSITLNFDTPNVYSDLFVAFISDLGNNKYKYTYKKFNLGDSEVYFDNKQALTRGAEWNPSYPIPDITPVINGTVETFANQRGWLPGEVFYTYDYQTTSNAGYDNDFVALFKTIIFNYFPNGRKYDNLPQIKKSGYYNESVYPITTGDEPIVVSPVYKNDGGYHEISEAELYYYYFKGNPTVEELEALPKYRAIDLSKVYANNENNEVVKKPSYVLAYFGDGIPTIGQTGSYRFEKGYKIGFCYKSNTETDQKKKQGEVYGDGRLNYNINNYGNFKTSQLGNTDPRMAWMSVNDKTYLCVESGTDKDFNDLILEVEGGIEPIIIPPVDPEYNFYTFLFEDHNLGDYDMNDVVLKGRRVNETTVEYTLMACGAYDELYIYNVEGKDINKDKEVHKIFAENLVGQYVNTQTKNAEYVVNTITVNKNFSFLDVTTQPYIYDATINNTVKIARQGQDPHAIMIPYDFRWPKEKICIKDAYNEEGYKFNSWGINKIDATDWYKHPTMNKVF